MIFCEFNWVRPLRAHLDARERSLQDWERINRQERETIATIKTLSTEEVRKWVATLDEQNQRFSDLQNKLHHQEIELTGPATSYIIIAAVVTVAVIGLVVFWLRDANAAAATTLENVVVLAPEDMMRSLLVAGLARRDPISVIVEEKPAALALPTRPKPALLDSGYAAGEVVEMKGTFGYILPDGESKRIWFHISDVLAADRQNLCEGARVSFRRGVGKRGPKAIAVRRAT
jgi:cold shock CspA family protein